MMQIQERRLGRKPRDRCPCGARLTDETVARDARGYRQGVCCACQTIRARLYRRTYLQRHPEMCDYRRSGS